MNQEIRESGERKRVRVSIHKLQHESNEIEDISNKRFVSDVNKRKQSFEARSDPNFSEPTYEIKEELSFEARSDGSDPNFSDPTYEPKEEIASEEEADAESDIEENIKGLKMIKFEEFLASKQGNQDEFWRQRGVRKRLGE